MQQRERMLWLLIPPHQQTAQAVHPGMCPLHHPPPCFEPRFVLASLRFFAPRAHRRRKAELLHNRVHLSIVVARPASRHMPCGRSAVGSGRSTTRLSMVGRTNFMSCRLAPSTTRPSGTPCPSVSRLRLTPDLPRSVGLRPVVSQWRRNCGPKGEEVREG